MKSNINLEQVEALQQEIDQQLEAMYQTLSDEDKHKIDTIKEISERFTELNMPFLLFIKAPLGSTDFQTLPVGQYNNFTAIADPDKTFGNKTDEINNIVAEVAQSMYYWIAAHRSEQAPKNVVKFFESAFQRLEDNKDKNQ